IGLLVIEAVSTVNSRKLPVDPEAVEHRAAEMDGLVRQYSKFAIPKLVQRVADPRVQDGTVQHMGAVVGKKHLQSALNIGLRSFGAKRPADQHQSSVPYKTCNLLFRQIRQIELISDVIDRGGEILFGVNQSTVEIEDENRTHGVIIAS